MPYEIVRIGSYYALELDGHVAVHDLSAMQARTLKRLLETNELCPRPPRMPARGLTGAACAHSRAAGGAPGVRSKRAAVSNSCTEQEVPRTANNM